MTIAADTPSTVKTSISPPSGAALWGGGAVLLWGLYVCVFVITTGERLTTAIADAAANVFPFAILAAAIHAILKAQVMIRSVPVQAVAHGGLALGFATTWYALVIVSLAFANGLAGRGYAVSGFSGPAFTWQVFQGLILYAAVAAVCYAIRGGREAASVTLVTTPLDRYLTRTGDDIVPVNVHEIISITGAQDYAEVVTATGRHLVRMSLGELEHRLDPMRFVRVHRSTIINFDQLARIEPAGGGRMLAHMANSDTVQVSRAGAQILRRFIV